ncbi:MAG: segregation/condensation protein A, partial [Candidatus Aenigmatarchaeota archaeon]
QVLIMDEKQIMQLITSEYSWEQIIYKIVAWEGLDPWDLDLKALSKAFLQYLVRMETLDFHVPAKYIIIAAVLLRMKSDHLKFLEILDGQEMPEIETEDSGFELDTGTEQLEVTPISAPPKRFARRRVMVDELVTALRRALSSQERRDTRRIKRVGKVKIEQEDVTKRIEQLYERIEALLKRLKDEEIAFSKLVKKWERKEVVDTFLPLIYLDSDRKVRCRQEEMFSEIFIKKREAK